MKSILTRKFYSRKVFKLETYFNLQYGNENQGPVVSRKKVRRKGLEV